MDTESLSSLKQRVSSKASLPVLLWACGLFVAFFLPWLQWGPFGLSGYQLGQLGSSGNYAWVVPILAAATVALSFKIDNRPIGALAGVIPIVGFVYLLLRGLSEVSAPRGAFGFRSPGELLQMVPHILGIGGYITIICSIALIVCTYSFWSRLK